MPTLQQTQDLYSPWVGLVYVFNLIVGTGALTLPAVFSQAGWLLSSILILILAVAGYMTVTFIIESIACANAIQQWTMIQSHKIDGESEALLDTDSDHENANEETLIINRGRYYTLNEKLELGQMAHLFFNKVGRTLFFISLCIYLFGDLTIYVTAVSKTLADLTCQNDNSTDNTTDDFSAPCERFPHLDTFVVYRIYVAMFALIVAPFSYFNVQKTKYLQIATSTMRWFAFSVMIVLASVRLIEYGQEGFPPVARFTGVPALLGASVYSFMCHHSLPGLVAPIAEKKNVIKLLGFDYLLICTFYILLAITGSFAFSNLYDLYTLNFVPSSLKHTGVFMEILEYYLALFPVFTLSTSFPVIAITLQNNLKSLFLDVSSMDRYSFVLRRLLFPTVTILPPLAIALVTHNVSSLVEFTGTYGGAAIQYVIPAVLVFCARKHCTTRIGSISNNKYASPFKGTVWIIFILSWSAACVVLVTINLLSPYL